MTPAERTAHAIVEYAHRWREPSQAALEKAVALVSQAIREEREACARICADVARQLDPNDDLAGSANPEDREAAYCSQTALDLAERIRSRRDGGRK